MARARRLTYKPKSPVIRSFRTRRRLIFALIGAAATGGVGLARPSRADEPAPFTLAWEAPAGCQSGAEVETAVRALLGEARVAPEKRVDAQAVVTRAGSSWRVELATRRGEARGSRTIEAGSCRELADVVALALALAIDPDRATRSPASAGATPAPKPSAVEVAAPPPSEKAERRPPPPRPPPPRDAVVRPPTSDRAPPAIEETLGAGIAVDAAALPGVRFGPALSFGLIHRRLRADATATFLPPTLGGQHAAGGTTLTEKGDARFWLFSGSLRGCYLLTSGVEIGPCAGGEIGVIHGSTIVSQKSSQAAVWAAASVGAALGWRFYRGFALWVPALVEVGLDRPRFTIQGTAAPVHQPAPVTGRLEIGLEVRF